MIATSLLLLRQQLFRGATRHSHTPHLACAAINHQWTTLGRCFHISAFTLGGRHTTGITEREKHWRQHISKKALKRYRERRVRRRVTEGAARGNQRAALQSSSTSNTSLATTTTHSSGALSALPSAAVLQSRSAENQRALESMLALAPPTLQPQASLAAVDSESLLDALRSGRLPRTEPNVTYAIRALGAQGRFGDALALFSALSREGVSPNVYTYTALISACAQQRNLAAARDVVSAMTEAGVAPSIVTFGALMQACVRAHDLPAAFGVLADAEASALPLSPVLFTHLIVGCVHAGHYERAWEVFRHMRVHHCEPDAVTFTALISAAAKKDEVERALGLLTEMKQMGLEPTHVTYNALIHAAGRSFRRFSHAFDLYEEMGASGFAVDVRTLHGVLLACSHSGDVVRARGFLHATSGRGVVPDRIALNTLLSVYARALGGKTPTSAGSTRDGGVSAAASALALRSEGKELLAWDDPKTAPMLAGARPLARGEYARLVDGDVDVLVENMLADYFNEDVTGRALDPEDEAVEASVEESVDALLPAVSVTNQDVHTPEFKAGADALVALGIVQRSEMDELIASNDRAPSIDLDEEGVRAEVDAASEAMWQSRVEAGALALAEEDGALGALALETQDKADALARELGLRGPPLLDQQQQLTTPSSKSSQRSITSQQQQQRSAMSSEALRRVLSGRLLVDDKLFGVLTTASSSGSAVADQPGDAAVMHSTTPDGSVVTSPSSSSSASSVAAPLTDTVSALRPATPTKRTTRPSASARLRAAAAGGPGITFLEYMRSLESEVDSALFGADVAPIEAVPSSFSTPFESADASLSSLTLPLLPPSPPLSSSADPASASATALVSASTSGAHPPAAAAELASPSFRLPSVFESDGEIGGVAMSSLLDIGSLPVPDTDDSDGDHDPMALHDYYYSAVTDRVANALETEFHALTQRQAQSSASASARSGGGGGGCSGSVLSIGPGASPSPSASTRDISLLRPSAAARPLTGLESEWSDPELSDHALEYTALRVNTEQGQQQQQMKQQQQKQQQKGEKQHQAAVSRDRSLGRTRLRPAAAPTVVDSAHTVRIDLHKAAVATGDITPEDLAVSLVPPASASATAPHSAATSVPSASATSTTVAATAASPEEFAFDGNGLVVVERVASTPLSDAAASAAQSSTTASSLVRRRRSGVIAVGIEGMPPVLPRPASMNAAAAATAAAAASAASRVVESAVSTGTAVIASSSSVVFATSSSTEREVSEWLARLDHVLSRGSAATSPAATGGATKPTGVAMGSTAAAAIAATTTTATLTGDAPSASRQQQQLSVAESTASTTSPSTSPLSSESSTPILAVANAATVAADGNTAAAATAAAVTAAADDMRDALTRSAAVWAERPAVVRANMPLEQTLRRGFAARIMAALLRQRDRVSHTASVDASLVLATEGLRKYRKRRLLGLLPGFIDTMVAARALKQRFSAETTAAGSARVLDTRGASTRTAAAGVSSASTITTAIADQRHPPTSAAAAVAAADHRLGMVEAAVSAAMQERHTARQDAALQRLAFAAAGAASAASAPPGAPPAHPRSKRFSALTTQSDTLMDGFAWLPRDDYPSDPRERKRVLLEEMRRLYAEELPRLNIRPDDWTLNTYLTGLCVAGQGTAAYAFLASEYPKHGIVPDVVTYRALIKLHVAQRDTAKAEAVIDAMTGAGVAPDKDCLGMLVHARARDYRIKDALSTVRDMRERGLECSEHHAALLRDRCKELGVRHPDVPAHPLAWQFTPRVKAMRRAFSRTLNKVVAHGLRQRINGRLA